MKGPIFEQLRVRVFGVCDVVSSSVNTATQTDTAAESVTISFTVAERPSRGTGREHVVEYKYETQCFFSSRQS